MVSIQLKTTKQWFLFIWKQQHNGFHVIENISTMISFYLGTTTQ
jgi:hypothetical protein